MEINWTIEVIVNFISSIPYFISFYMLNQHYSRHKDRIILSLMITWGVYGIYWLTNGLAYLFLSTDIFKINKVLLFISSISLIYAFDLMEHEKINPIEISFVILLSGLIFNAILEPDSIVLEELANGDQTVAHGSEARLLIFILASFISLVYLYYTSRIYQRSTTPYKQYALILLIGAVIFGPLVVISFMLRFGTYVPGISALISSFGVLLTTFAIQKSPQLIYILRTQVTKLSVIDRNTGLTLYTYDWNPDLIHVEDSLIASVLESISIFTQEVLDKGAIREIHLENSMIYVDYADEFNCHFILICDNRSIILRHNLKVFVNLFTQTFEKNLREISRPVIETSEFEKANLLIPLAFPYIPSN